jgi:SAM-dependent methyltransferase
MGSFDVVTMFAVIEHLHESPRALLNLAGELLRPSGILCITMPNAVNLRKRLSVLTGRSNYPSIEQFFYSAGSWRGHVREYTLDETRWICEAAGFKVVEASTFEALAHARLPRWLVPAFLLVCEFLPRLRSGLCVVAQKPEGWSSRPEAPEKYREAVRRAVPEGVR